MTDGPHMPADELFEGIEEPGARADAERALAAIEFALGEDSGATPGDPGLPPDYVTLDVLGQGAGGIVYRAKQLSLDREVAVKVLHTRPDPRGIERLYAEARRLAGLHHVGIVKVYEVGRTAGGVYIAMELLQGGSLQDLLARGPLNPEHAARLVQQAAEALAYTHGRGVVHLDLKPANVLLDELGNAHLADFGIARELGQAEHSASGGLVGTPMYMAPEQAADDRAALGERTDVYGLGVLLYTCLTAKPPFAGRSLGDTLHAVRFEEPQPIRRAAPNTPQDLLAIAEVAMAKDPAQRYTGARAVAQDLARYEAGQPVEARPPGHLRRVARRIHLHRRELVSALLAMVLTALSFLPFFDPDETADRDMWRAALRELAAAEEPRAVSVLLEHLRREGQLTQGDVDALATLVGTALRAAPQGDLPSALAAAKESLPQRVGRAAYDRASKPPFDALDVERAEREVLARAIAQATAGDAGPEDVEAVAAHPLWAWQGAWTAWEQDEPGRPQVLLDQLWALTFRTGGVPRLDAAQAELTESPTPLRVGARIDTWIVFDNGETRRLWTGAGEGTTGESLRLEGWSDLDPGLPRARFGLNVLGLPRRSTDFDHRFRAKVEAEGRFEQRAGGVVWALRDREVWLPGGSTRTGGFVHFATDGLLVGQPGLLEAYRLVWAGGGATVLTFGEATILSDSAAPPPARTLEELSGSLMAGVQRDLEPAGGTWPDAPALRAAAIDRLIGAALCTDASGAGVLRGIHDRIAANGVEPADMSSEFFGAEPFAGVTRAGASAGFWLTLPAKLPNAAPGPRFDQLPASRSIERGFPRGPTGKEWVAVGQLLWSLWVLAAVLWARRHSATRLAFLGAAVLLPLLVLDKSVGTPWGQVPLDPLACALSALASALLLPWSGRWGQLAVGLMALATAQEVLRWTLGFEAPRVPLAIAIWALGMAATHIRSQRSPWIEYAAPALLCALLPAHYLVPADVAWHPWIVHSIALWALWLLMILVFATATRARDLAPATG